MDAGGRKWLVFLVVSLGVFLSTLDSSMVNIALPAIMAEFHSPLHKTEWVVISYLLATSTTLLVWGHFSDRLGRSRFYGLGFFVFGIGSLSCAMSQTLNYLIAARFVQALGAAMLMANGPALIRQVFPPEKLGRSMGFVGIPVSLGLMCGPVVGGYLIEFFSWRALFYLSLPVCFTFSLLSLFILPVNPSSERSSGKFDWPGALIWALLLAGFSFFLTHAVPSGISWWLAFVLAGAALPAVMFFIRLESRAADPVLPLSLLKRSFFSIGVMSALLSFLILFSVLILIPFYLDRVLGLSASRVGLVMLTIPVTVLVVAPVAGWLSDYLGAKILSTLGLACSSLGLLLLSFLSPHTSPWGVAARLLFLGVGQAMFLSPNSASVLGRLGNKKSGTAAALLATARNIGMMLGVALAGMFFSFFFRLASGGYDLRNYEAGMAGYFCQALSATFLVFLLVGLFSVYLSWQRPLFVARKRASDIEVNEGETID